VPYRIAPPQALSKRIFDLFRWSQLSDSRD
jgi:hypothetical protein